MSTKTPEGAAYPARPHDADPLNREKSLTDRTDARDQLRQAVDELSQRANVYARMQMDPLKLIGGASGVGLVLGLLLGSRLKRTKIQKVYVDAYSPEKEQKALVKAQVRGLKGKGGGGSGVVAAILSSVMTIGMKVLQERVIAPKLEEFADQLNQQSQQKSGQAAPGHTTPGRP